MENDKHLNAVDIIDNTVVMQSGGGFCWRHDHALSSFGEISRQNTTQIHTLLPLSIRLRISILGRIICIDSKICAIAKVGS